MNWERHGADGSTSFCAVEQYPSNHDRIEPKQLILSP
jgi:hypothetical protein